MNASESSHRNLRRKQRGRFHGYVFAAIGLLVCLSGCPQTTSEILEFGSWHLWLTQDGEGGVPAHDLEGGLWDSGFWDNNLVLDGFPGSRLASSLPYQSIDGTIVAEGRLSVKEFYQYRRPQSRFDSLNVGDTFATAEITSALTGYSTEYGTWMLTGSYIITFDEEWGGETFTGTFEGRRYIVTAKDEAQSPEDPPSIAKRP